MVAKVLMSGAVLIIIPLLTGAAICRLLSIKKHICSFYLTGMFTEWAFIQIIGVPLIILKKRFTTVVIITTVFLVLMSLIGLYGIIKEKRQYSKPTVRNKSIPAIFSFILMVAGYVTVAILIFLNQTISPDDSRFVVTAVDIVRTDRMFLTNPSTGRAIAGLWGDMHRDAVSPWAVYIAYISKTTGIYATTMAHTILPQVLMLCMASIYWLIADTFFKDNLFEKCAFVLIAFLVTVYGEYSDYNAETFALKRIWQGKAVIAACGIPAMFLVFFWIYQEPVIKKLILLYIVCFAFCLMSGMGIIISGIMCLAFGIAYGIIKKKISLLLGIWGGAAIPFMYYGISLLKY